MELRDAFNEIRELRTARIPVLFLNLVDREDVEALEQLRKIDAKLAEYDLRTLLAEETPTTRSGRMSMRRAS